MIKNINYYNEIQNLVNPNYLKIYLYKNDNYPLINLLFNLFINS